MGCRGARPAQSAAMRMRHIELIHALLQTGSISSAARLLNITQPAATRHLQHAELTVGFALFHRHAGRLHPTEELLQLAPVIRSAFSGIDDVRRTVLNLRSRPQPRLRVGTVPALTGLLPRAYRALHQRFPDLRCEFGSGHHHELTQSLLLREIDVAVAFDPPAHPAIAFEELASCHLVCAALPAQLGKFARAAAIDAADLATMSLIELHDTDPVGRLVSRYGEHHGWRFPAPVAVKTHRAALELAAEGLGVAVVDNLSVATFQPRLTVLRIEPQADILLRAMVLRPGSPSVAAAAFLSALRAAINLGALDGIAAADVRPPR